MSCSRTQHSDSVWMILELVFLRSPVLHSINCATVLYFYFLLPSLNYEAKNKITMIYLRNKFSFLNIHGIMNTLGLLQSKRNPKGFTITLQETRSIHDSMKRSKILIYCLYLHFIINILYIKNIFNLGIKTVLYLKYNRINGFVVV